jgi:hypothetical protein
VGEGGNLGLTRPVEYASQRAHQRRLHRQLGQRRLLDHEVNLKILLGTPSAAAS